MPNDVVVSAPPPGWIKSPLRTLADVAFSSVDKKSRPRDPKVRLCNYLDVYQNDYVHDGMPYMEVTATQSEVRKFGLREGDVLITKDSETPDDIGIPTVVNDVGSDVVCGYHLALIRPRVEINPRFLAKQLATERIRRYFAKEANGTTRYSLSTTSVMEIPLWLPAESEQRRIAEILDTLDEAIRKTEQVIAKLQQMKQGLLHDLLTRGIDDNGELRDPDRHPEQFKDSPLGRIPKGWDGKRVGDLLLRIEQGWSPDCESTRALPAEWGVLRTTAVVWEGYQDSENKALPRALSPRPAYEVQASDVLMTRAGPNSRVGVVALVKQTQGRRMLSDKLYRLVPSGATLPAYLVLGLSGVMTQRHLSTLKTGLAESQTNISQQIVRSLWFPVPPVAEQAAIAEAHECVLHQTRTEELELDKLRILKHGLMDDLLTGRVRVPVVEDAAR